MPGNRALNYDLGPRKGESNEQLGIEYYPESTPLLIRIKHRTKN